jgi:hypothetical protein
MVRTIRDRTVQARQHERRKLRAREAGTAKDFVHLHQYGLRSGGPSRWKGVADQTRSKLTEVSPRDVALKMRIDYSRGIKDLTTRNLESMCEHCWKLERSNFNQDSFIRDAAELICKLFSIESVAIGIKDHDGLYRYKAVVGLDKEVADGYMTISYRGEELFDPKTYPSYEISRHTKLFLTEDHPYAQGEEFTYRRPGLIGMKRLSLTDSLEADYLDVLSYGHDNEVLGFIEISGTRLRKLPDPTTIRWVELMAGILGAAMQRQR